MQNLSPTFSFRLHSHDSVQGLGAPLWPAFLSSHWLAFQHQPLQTSPFNLPPPVPWPQETQTHLAPGYKHVLASFFTGRLFLHLQDVTRAIPSPESLLPFKNACPKEPSPV